LPVLNFSDTYINVIVDISNNQGCHRN